ncbi:protein of unknown function [Burkholderia multivorans]
MMYCAEMVELTRFLVILACVDRCAGARQKIWKSQTNY